MRKKLKWQTIGTVLGETNINEFFFSLKNYQAKKGDIVATETNVPDGNGKIISVTVWGKIMSIDCSNEWFPRQAAQELANEDIDIRDTILPTTRDELICKVSILGYTKNNEDKLKLLPLVYPVKPACKRKLSSQ